MRLYQSLIPRLIWLRIAEQKGRPIVATQTYRIKAMRVVRPSAKIQEAHPERVFTVKGEFYDEEGNKLSITSKDITVSYAKSDEFNIDIRCSLRPQQSIL